MLTCTLRYCQHVVAGNEMELLSPFKYSADATGKAKSGSEDVNGAAKTRSILKCMEKAKRTFYIFFEEESLRERKNKVRSVGALDQTEWMHVVTRKQLTTALKSKVKFTGTTGGNVIAPVAVPDFDSLWQLPFAEKKELVGDARVAVGGRDEDDSDDDHDDEVTDKKKHRVRQPTDLEPVYYHSYPIDLMHEAMHLAVARKADIQGIIDFTPADGPAALMSIRENIAYLGVCHTDAHVQSLYKWLVKQLLNDFKTEGSAHYKPRLAQLLSEGAEDEEAPQPAPRAKAKASGKAKAKAKAAVARASKATKAAKAAAAAAEEPEAAAEPVDSGAEEEEEEEE